MGASVLQSPVSAHYRLPDKASAMAKVDPKSIRKADTQAYYTALGRCVEDVRHVFKLSLKEFATELGKDERQVSRWMDGSDRPQIEAVFAVDRFRAPLVIALAQMAAGVDVQTVVTIRRTA